MNNSWSTLHKIVFRFFFVFFLLEVVFALDFLTLMGGVNMNVMMFGQKVYTPPFLWLNENVFHFYYNPWTWWTLTSSLTLIRFISFLVISSIAALIWTAIDRKRPSYNRFDFWMRSVLTISLSCVMWGYGMVKTFPVQMMQPDFIDLLQPFGNFYPMNMVWIMMGYGVPYQMFTGIVEALASGLILFRRTRLVGLLIMLAILTNLVIMNYTYAIGVLTLTSLLLCINVYLLVPYLKSTWYFFFTGLPVIQSNDIPHYKFTTPWKKWAVMALAVAVIGYTYYSNIQRGYKRYMRNAATNVSKKYFEVTNFVIDNDTLKDRILDDTIRWRFWGEKLVNNQPTVTIYAMKYEDQPSRNFTLTKDSVTHTLTLKPSGGNDTIPVILTYRDINKESWHLEGMMKGNSIAADLTKVDPNSYLKLLRMKRQIFEKDREVWW